MSVQRTLSEPEDDHFRQGANASLPAFLATLPAPAVTWGRRVLIVLAYCLATVIMTRPWLTRLGSYLPSGGDPLLQIWISRWVQHALLTDPLHLYDANMFFPLKYTLAYSDSNIPAGIMAAPIYLLTGNAALANNLLVLGTFVLAATGIYALVQQLVNNRAVAFLAGLAYAFLPYRYAHLWHLNQLGHAWTPWALFALVLLIQRQRWRYALAFGLLCAVQVLTSFYVGFQLAFAVAVVLLVAVIGVPQARQPRFWLQFAAAGLLALVLIIPLAWPYIQVRDQQGLERTITEAENYRAYPASYFRVQAGNRFWTFLTERKGGEDTLFPGGLVLLGACLGLLAARRRPLVTTGAVVLALFGVILSLGPTWHPDSAGGGFPLPYRFLFDHFPFFKAMRVPARFGALALLALVVLTGSGAAWVWSLLRGRFSAPARLLVGSGLTALLAVLLLTELFTQVRLVQLDTSPETAAPYLWLAQQPGTDPIMDFPVPATEGAAIWMYWSTLHWKPLVGGYSGFVPSSYDELLQSFTSDLQRPDGSVAGAVSYPSANNIGVLQTLRVRYILMHRDSYKREDWQLAIAQLEATGVVEKVAEFDKVSIYLLAAATKPPAPISTELSAPGQITVGHFWEPALVLSNPTNQQELFFLGRSLTLTTTWRDSNGKIVREDTRPLPLPAVLPGGDLFCSVRVCPTVPGAPLPPPGPDSPQLYPSQPGRYTVELAINGGYQQQRTFSVEVVGTTPAAQPGPPLALLEATIAETHLIPGGQLPLRLQWETRQPMSEDLTLFAQLIGPDGKVWGQADAPAGWTGHYTTTWEPGEQLTLPWLVPLQADAPLGTYRVLVGIYRRTPTGVERLTLAYPTGEATEYWVGEVSVP